MFHDTCLVINRLRTFPALMSVPHRGKNRDPWEASRYRTLQSPRNSFVTVFCISSWTRLFFNPLTRICSSAFTRNYSNSLKCHRVSTTRDPSQSPKPSLLHQPLYCELPHRIVIMSEWYSCVYAGSCVIDDGAELQYWSHEWWTLGCGCWIALAGHQQYRCHGWYQVGVPAER